MKYLTYWKKSETMWLWKVTYLFGFKILWEQCGFSAVLTCICCVDPINFSVSGATDFRLKSEVTKKRQLPGLVPSNHPTVIQLLFFYFSFPLIKNIKRNMERGDGVDMQQQPLTRLEPRSLWLHGMCFKPPGFRDAAFDGFVGGKKQCLSLITLCCGTNNI